jgi:hypothetical protein
LRPKRRNGARRSEKQERRAMKMKTAEKRKRTTTRMKSRKMK